MALCEANSNCLTTKASTALLHRRSILRMLFFGKVDEHLREKQRLNVRKASHSMDLKCIFNELNVKKIKLWSHYFQVKQQSKFSYFDQTEPISRLISLWNSKYFVNKQQGYSPVPGQFDWHCNPQCSMQLCFSRASQKCMTISNHRCQSGNEELPEREISISCYKRPQVPHTSTKSDLSQFSILYIVKIWSQPQELFYFSVIIFTQIPLSFYYPHISFD